jgi:hypothetical protein
MVVGEVGRVRTFQISLWAMALLGGFLVVFVISSVAVINKYLGSLPLSQRQGDRVHQLETDIRSLRKELKRSRQYSTVLEKIITEQKVARQKSVSSSPEKPEALEQLPAQQVSAVAEKPKEDVGIEDVAITRDGTTLTVQFKLLRVSESASPASGHVYIIAMNGSTDPPQYWTYPKVALRDGVPIRYDRGEFFKIKRFRMIRGTYYMEEESDLPSSIQVLIYDTSGRLMLKQDFKVPSDKVREVGH